LYFISFNGIPQNTPSKTNSQTPNFASQINNSNVIANSIDKNIRSIFQDSKGNYWFGTNGDGVAALIGGWIVQQKTQTSPLENFNNLGYLVVAVILINIALTYRVYSFVSKRK